MRKLHHSTKRAWVKALRSGKFKQGKDMLYNPKKDTYCCLGVAAKCGFKNAIDSEADPYYDEPGKNEYLRDSFLDFEIQSQLAEMNDGCNRKKSMTFKQIADWIEENL